MVSPAEVAVNVTVPTLIAVIKPVLGFTVAEPLPATIANVMAPPRPPVAVVVTVAVIEDTVVIVLAEVIIKIGVPLLMVIS